MIIIIVVVVVPFPLFFPNSIRVKLEEIRAKRDSRSFVSTFDPTTFRT